MSHQFIEAEFVSKENENEIYHGYLCEKCGFKVIAVPELEEELEYYPDHQILLVKTSDLKVEEVEKLCEKLEIVCK